MNRKTAAGFLGTLAALMLAAATQAACPPLPAPAELAAQQQSADSARDLFEYAVLRLLKCGWDEAVPAFDPALEASRGSGQSNLQRNILLLGTADPRDLAGRGARWSRDRDGWLGPLRLRDDEIEAATRRLEAAMPRFFERLLERADGPLPPPLDRLAELVLAVDDVRRGDVARGRDRLDRAAQMQPGLPAYEAAMVRQAAKLRAALDPQSPVEPPPQAWVLDRRSSIYTESCGVPGRGNPALDPLGLRADLLRADGDPGAALALLLRHEWGGPEFPMVSHWRRLQPLLERRYSRAQLRQGWLDAEGSIHTDDAQPGLLLYGVELPLPSAVLEDDPADPERSVRRPPRRDEAVAAARATPLFAALFPDGLR
ncbi:hypothetical protein [Tahibacter caeni]|uniref:hypothetical protein n=1 Tax=Tahibacter caeni TaxID=1453545 RepID=UPI0021491E50|nr:hypothetical protein [Tahibacter caeni]